jgi:hypothetical protein
VADLVLVLALLGDLQAQDAVVCTDGEVTARYWPPWSRTCW